MKFLTTIQVVLSQLGSGRPAELRQKSKVNSAVKSQLFRKATSVSIDNVCHCQRRCRNHYTTPMVKVPAALVVYPAALPTVGRRAPTKNLVPAALRLTVCNAADSSIAFLGRVPVHIQDATTQSGDTFNFNEFGTHSFIVIKKRGVFFDS